MAILTRRRAALVSSCISQVLFRTALLGSALRAVVLFEHRACSSYLCTISVALLIVLSVVVSCIWISYISNKRTGLIHYVLSATMYSVPFLLVLVYELLHLFACELPGSYQHHLRTLLRVGTAELNAASVDYFITGGTLLSWARGAPLIPWEGDVDIVVSAEEANLHRYNNLTARWKQLELENRDPSLVRVYTNQWVNGVVWFKARHPYCPTRDSFTYQYRETQTHFGMKWGFLDLYVLGCQDTVAEEIQEQYGGDESVITRQFPSVPCKFLGEDVRCPRNAKELLTAGYGSNYLIPDNGASVYARIDRELFGGFPLASAVCLSGM